MDVNGRPSLRDEQAELTRRRITQAARSLFARRGYGATTLQSVAVEAGVAVQTVYATYGSKAGLLRALRLALMVQPEAEELYRRALSAGTAAERLELFAQSIRRRWEVGADIVRIHVEAASTDPAVRAEVDDVLARRRGGLARLAESLVAGGGTDALEASAAAAILDALTLPEIYLELTSVHGWSPDRYEAWLAATMAAALLST